jgi:hypothetical protein
MALTPVRELPAGRCAMRRLLGRLVLAKKNKKILVLNKKSKTKNQT